MFRPSRTVHSRVNNDGASIRATVASNSSRPAEDGDPGWVVIVEDDAATLRSVERLLQASGFATRGFIAAERLLEGDGLDHAMALVLDIDLGCTSGFDLGRTLHASGWRVPIIFVTGRDHAGARAEAAGLGCLAYLVKPFAAEELMQALARCRDTTGRGSAAGLR